MKLGKIIIAPHALANVGLGSKGDLGVGLLDVRFRVGRRHEASIRRSRPARRAGLNKARAPRKLSRMLMIVTVSAILG
jgi:hypothetical protein